MDVPGFDVVDDIPSDSLHLLHLGITKKTWERMTTSQSRKIFGNNHTRNRYKMHWERMFVETKVPTEIRHKTGTFNARMKGSEWQTVDCHCLPAFADVLEGNSDLRHILFSYTFLVRALHFDDPVYNHLAASVDLKTVNVNFLKRYARVFGEITFSFNLHQMLHLVDVRNQKGPLWKYSTGKFEGMYGRARRCYKANTPNCAKQLLENFHSYQVIDDNHANHPLRNQNEPFFHARKHRCYRQAAGRCTLFGSASSS